MVRIFYFLAVSIGLLAGCGQAPKRVAAPGWNPESLADAVIAKLDKNGDGSIDKTELAAAPGLAWGVKATDTDKNGAVSRDELVARFALYKKLRIGITSARMNVSYQGRPLAGAKVTLVPEFFLAETIEPASGEVLPDGSVDPQIPDAKPPGLRVGYYRVVVESPTIKVPAKYTSAESTPLGVEVPPSNDGTLPDVPQLVLRN